MDQEIVDIMSNFDQDWNLYSANNTNNRFHRFFAKKGVTNHRRIPTRDGSIVIGPTGSAFSPNNTYLVKYHVNGCYIGPLKGELRHGFGYRSYADPELFFAGDYQNNLKQGKGKLWSRREKRWVFDGNWANDLKNGYGEMWKNGVTYKGNWVNDKLDGIGRMDWPSGQFYEGGFANDLRNGEGTMTFPNGDQYVGSWKNGRPHGKGVYQWKSGEVYEGTWSDGVMDGSGAIDYGIPIKGMGSVRMGSVQELNFQLQRPEDWEAGINKSSMFIKSYRETIVPEHIKRQLKPEKTSDVGTAGFDGKAPPANINYSIGPAVGGGPPMSYSTTGGANYNYGTGSNVSYGVGGSNVGYGANKGGFQANVGEYKVSTGADYKVNTGDYKVSTGDYKVSTSDYKVGGTGFGVGTGGDYKVTTTDYKVTTTTPDYKVSTGSYGVSGGDYQVSTGNYGVSTGDYKVSTGDYKVGGTGTGFGIGSGDYKNNTVGYQVGTGDYKTGTADTYKVVTTEVRDGHEYKGTTFGTSNNGNLQIKTVAPDTTVTTKTTTYQTYTDPSVTKKVEFY